MNALAYWGYAIGAVYIAALVVAALIASRKASQGTEQLYLGGRSMPPFVIGIAYVTATTSASIYLGEPGIAYSVGWPALWVAIAIVPGLIVPALLLTNRLRRFSVNLGSTTMPSYLGARYSSDAVRIVLAVIILLFYILPIMAQYKGVAVLFEVILGIPNVVSIIAFAGVIAFYVSTGGFRAVALNDCIQVVPMILFSVVLLGVSYVVMGGFSGLNSNLQSIDPELTNFFEPSLFSPLGVIGVYVFWLMVMVSNPYVSIKLMAMRSSGRRSMKTFLLVALALIALLNLNYIIGLAARVALPGISNPDYATMEMATTYLHPALAALMMVGVLAAVMSTISSLLLVVGQAVAEDLYRKTFNPDASSTTVLWLTRATVVGVSLIAVVLSLLRTPELLSIVLFIGLTGVGLAVAPPLIVGLFWDGATKWGALASMLLAVPLYSYFLLALEMGIYEACLYGAAVAFPTMILVSLITKPPGEEVLNRLKNGTDTSEPVTSQDIVSDEAEERV